MTLDIECECVELVLCGSIPLRPSSSIEFFKPNSSLTYSPPSSSIAHMTTISNSMLADSGFKYGGHMPPFTSQENRMSKPGFTSSHYSGPVFDPETGDLNKNLNPKDAFSLFFGNPIRHVSTEYDTHEKELKDLPEAFHGKNPFLRNVIISQISQAELYPVNEVLPWTKKEDSLEISWDKIIFNDHMLGRTPEEAPSRLLSSFTGQGRASMVRYGISLLLEHGFMKTEAGRMHYSQNILQIRNAVVETAALGAMSELADCKPSSDPWNVWRDDSSRNSNDIARIFEMELAQFAVLQKNPNGAKFITEKATEAMQQSVGNNPDYWIFPSGARKYVEDATAGIAFIDSGLKLGETRDLLGDAIGRAVFRESRAFRLGEKKKPYDPFVQMVAIGEFGYINNQHLYAVDPKNFKSRMLHTTVYDEDKDAMVSMTLENKLHFTGLFHNWNKPGPKPLTEIGEDFFKGLSSWGEFMEKHELTNYTVKGIQSKSPQVQAAFAALISKTSKEIVDQSSTSGYFVNGNSSKSPYPTTSIRSSSTGSSKRMTVSKSNRDELMDEIFQLTPQTPEKRDILGRYIDYLLNIDEIRSTEFAQSLPKMIKNYLDKNSNDSNDLSIFMMGLLLQQNGYGEKTLIESDIDYATRLIRVSNRTELENNPSAESNRKSPHWITNHGAKSQTLSLCLDPVSGVNNHELVYSSQAFTLSNQYLCLFDLEQHSLDSITEHGIHFDHTDSDSMSESVMNKRVAFMQYAAQMSFLFGKINSLPENPSNSELEKTATALNSVILRQLETTRLTRTMAETALEASKLPVLPSQRVLGGFIEKLSSFILKFHSEPKFHFNRSTLLVLNASFKTLRDYELSTWVFNSIDSDDIIPNQSKSGAFHLSSDNPFYANPRFGRLLDLYKKNKPEEIDSLRSEGIKAVKELRQSIHGSSSNAKSKATSSSSADQLDSFEAYANYYIELYVIYKLLRFDTESNKDNRWKDMITEIDRKYTEHITQKHSGPNKGFAMINSLLSAIEVPYAADGRISIPPKLSEVSDDARLTEVGSQDSGRRGQLAETLKSFVNKFAYSDHTEYKPFNDTYFKKADILTMNSIVNFNVKRTDEYNRNQETAYLYLFHLINYVKSRVGREIDSDDFHMLLKAKLQDEITTHITSKDAKLASFMVFISGLTKYKADGNYSLEQWIDQYSKLDGVSGDSERGYKEHVENMFAGIDSDDFKGFNTAQIVEILYKLPITGSYVKFALDNDIICPIGIQWFRPHMQYDMGSGVALDRRGLGGTFYGHADMQLGDNVQLKTHFGHFTMYLKSVIFDDRKIVHMRNIICKKCLGGSGTKPWDPLDQQDLHNYHTNNLTKDIFITAIPINWHTESHHLDITGEYDRSLNASTEASRATQYPGCDIYRELWGWVSARSLHSDYKTDSNESNMNTICWQAKMMLYNASTNQYNLTVEGRGHWGAFSYNGVRKIREGQGKYLNRPDYEMNALANNSVNMMVY